ncbi:hypothetical protein RND59_00655 [Vibrio ruber]|uniref:hypothetical protein n=1 Tax=Vibrio ruber TaxID=184755 RepID=UPI0028929A0A|nr:hypothetical protein [Vibrio ruber]WNJ95667.1 hypothetical protein RND59_00655 [Vibrio ruber]
MSINKQLDVPYLPPNEWLPTGFDYVEGLLYRLMKGDGTLKSWVDRNDQINIHTDKATELFNRYMIK